ncbi:MAG TPA: endosialidase [Lachnospiraceae bacterium]|nr:endosialidase [Lachnospiraceae bacterium]
MAAVKTLIRAEEDGSISFGDYELDEKTKLSDFSHDGDVYKVKTFREITRLERNDMFVYESVPGTAVSHLTYGDGSMSFTVDGPEDAQITVEGEPDSEYSVYINEEARDDQKTNLGGKLSFSVELGSNSCAEVKIVKK